ncbi:MAG: aminopeptidase [Armatimonadetes bacterium]|nr:aminopeptidase [Armatimonadota bacterium]
MRSFEDNLSLFATLAVKEGVALAPGQELLVFAEHVAAPLVHLVAREAYRAGAKNVEVIWADPELALIRYAEGSDEAVSYAPRWLIDGVATAHRQNAARLGILSGDPALLAGVAPDKVAAQSRAQGEARKVLSEIIAGSEINWCLIGAASPAWAARVFPDLPSEVATAKLWDAIFLSSRVLEDDPMAAWREHSASLEARVRILDELRLDAVRFTGPGTDLRVGLVEGHLWAGGRGRANNGVLCSPNVPTEEVFCMPHRERVEGTVSSTMPLSLRGQIVDGIQVEFQAGKAVKVSASKGEDAFRKLVATDDSADRLGEVALVPHSSKVAQTGVLFLNTLYDENAASHIAFGASYGENLDGYAGMTPDERTARGANDSIVHVDWMIGSDKVDVDGVRQDGSSVPLMRAGEWVLQD